MGKIDYSQLRLLVLDVDGVLTDGRITLTEAGQEIKSFHCRDGSGMKYWLRAGGKLAIITGRGSPAVSARAREIGVEAVYLNAKEKLPVYQRALDELGVSARQTIVVGDDLPDLPLMTRCGFAVAVADAPRELKRMAAYVTKLPGGAGCVREVIELILKKAGKWDQILSRYLPAGGDR